MKQSKSSAKPTWARKLGSLVPILLFAPLSMAAKGCSGAVVGDDCPAEMACAGSANAGSANAGSSNAGSGNVGNGNAGSANAGSSNAGSSNAGSGAGGSSGAANCGGLLGQLCASGSYCAYSLAAHCGDADQTGLCQLKPEACDAVYAPVCGCDNKTYSSDCTAAGAGISVAKTGECAAAPGKVCGGLLGTTCATGEFCEFPIEASCGASDQTGVCTAKSGTNGVGGCTANYDPVCGCDGTTYGNACEAWNASVSVAALGECGPKACSLDVNGACPQGQYCNFPSAAHCGQTDGAGTCAVISKGVCPTIVATVCGCDGKNYGNSCLAGRAGISVASQGACQ